ncbi:MAG: RT0821/Lpp0805 family surface protein [Alphaproteobacteria bacterium]
MIFKAKTRLPILAAALILAGCSSDAGEKQTIGAILGGVGGAVVGTQFGSGGGRLAMTAVGTLLGAYLGSEVGSSLDRADQVAAQRAETQAHTAPIGQKIQWNNPDSGHYGSVTPVRDGTDSASGQYCREYQTTVTVGGETQDAFGTACQQPDGSWKIIG